MSLEELTSAATVAEHDAKKKSRKAKVRKHLLTTAYKNDITAKLDKLHVAGHTIISITPSADIRGFEIISYNEE